MNKIFIPLLIVLVFVTIIMPQHGWALTDLEDETNKLNEAEAIQKKAAENIKNAQSRIKSIQVQKNQTVKDVKSIEQDIHSLENEIDSLDLKIDSLDNTINTLNSQIDSLETEITSIAAQIVETNKEIESLEIKRVETEASLEESERLLQEAKERITARNSQLRERIRLMYTKGKVSYLEVLLNSTSFTDFLDRFSILKMLTHQDKKILVSNKKDHVTVTVKIAEIEQQLAQLAALQDRQAAAKAEQIASRDGQVAAKNKQVATKGKQVAAMNSQIAVMDKQVVVIGNLAVLKQTKKVQIAAMSKEVEALAHYTEEQEKDMIKAAAIIAASKKSIAYYKGEKLGYPLEKEYRISSSYGTRTHPITGKKGIMHKGIDFAAPAGTDILAAESGRVITAGWVSGYGNTVILDHGNGLWTLYAHARTGGIKVKVGQIVTRGQRISEVGMTGNSTGNHLHFEVRLEEKAVDPRGYLNL